MLSWTRALIAALVVPALLATASLSAPAHAAVRTEQPAVSHVAARSTTPVCWRRNHRCFSAMAVNLTTGRAFYVIDWSMRRGAVRGAMLKCQAKSAATSCRHAGWVTNGYLAVVYREVNGKGQAWASAIAYSQATARLRAHNRLAGPGTRRAWAWVGTTRAPRFSVNGGIRRGTW